MIGAAGSAGSRPATGPGWTSTRVHPCRWRPDDPMSRPDAAGRSGTRSARRSGRPGCAHATRCPRTSWPTPTSSTRSSTRRRRRRPADPRDRSGSRAADGRTPRRRRGGHGGGTRSRAGRVPARAVAMASSMRRSMSKGTRSTRTSSDLIEPPYDVVANMPYHITSPILHALLGAPPRPRADRPDGPARGRRADRRAARCDELPVGLRPVPRPRSGSRSRCPPERVRAGAGGRRRRSSCVEPYDLDDRLDAATEDEPLAAGPGRASANAARCSTTSWRGSCRSTPDARRRGAGRGRDRPATGGRRRSRWGSGCGLREALGPLGPDRADARPARTAGR